MFGPWVVHANHPAPGATFDQVLGGDALVGKGEGGEASLLLGVIAVDVVPLIGEVPRVGVLCPEGAVAPAPAA